MTIAGIVLAAGGGSRFTGGTHKLMAPLRGRPLVASVLDAVSTAGFDRVAVVTGAVSLEDVAGPEFTVLENPRWSEGLSTSVATALSWAEREGFEAVVLGLGDMPGVPSSAWRKVADAAGPVAVATFGGAPRPPVRLARAVWSEVPTTGDVGARSLWHRPGTIEVPCDGDPADVDTVEDLEAVRGAARSPRPAGELTHIDDRGRAVMVDVTHKAFTGRLAHTSSRVSNLTDAVGFVTEHPEFLTEARMAGLQGAKVTSDLIPLCHPLPLDGIAIDFAVEPHAIECRATAETVGQTGVEMEALVASTVSALCLLGRLRDVDPAASIEHLVLDEKRGGRSGVWRRAEMTAEGRADPPSVLS
jgi:cyclic pyranopterin phosphate synthase